MANAVAERLLGDCEDMQASFRRQSSGGTIINGQRDRTCSCRHKGMDQRPKCIGHGSFLNAWGLHARDKIAHLANDAVELADGSLEPLCVRLREALSLLFGQL